jgi:hypothetical protein
VDRRIEDGAQAEGEESLLAHLLPRATMARERYGDLSAKDIPAFLQDPRCVRDPTRLVFEFGEMAAHQFAQPDLDPRDPDRESWVLYVHPTLRDRPDLLPSPTWSP